MEDVADYLLEHYFPKYIGIIPIPTRSQIVTALEKFSDRVIVIRGKDIIGVGMYLTLTCETYENIDKIDICDSEAMAKLVLEKGEHIHFVMLCASSFLTIMQGLREVRKNRICRSVSWWNPDRTKLHRYNFN